MNNEIMLITAVFLGAVMITVGLILVANMISRLRQQIERDNAELRSL